MRRSPQPHPKTDGRRHRGGNLLTVCRPCHDAIHRGEIDVTDLVIEVQVKRTTRLLEAMSDNDANGSGADDDEHGHRADHRNLAFARSFVHSGSPYIPHSPKPIGKDVGFDYQQKKELGLSRCIAQKDQEAPHHRVN